MATLVLSTVGKLALGPVGGILGGMVGSYIDGQLMSALADPVEGPKLDELRIPSFDEGAPAPWAVGPENRVPGQVIWMSDMREQSNTSGGKGGGTSVSSTTYDYFIDIAIAFLRRETEGTHPVRKIWAMGTLLVERDIGFNDSSAKVSAAKYTQNGNFVFPGGSCVNKPYKEYIDYYHDPADANDDPNFFEGITTGETIVVSGFTNNANNGTFEVTNTAINLTGAITSKKSWVRVRRCNHAYNNYPT